MQTWQECGHFAFHIQSSFHLILLWFSFNISIHVSFWSLLHYANLFFALQRFFSCSVQSPPRPIWLPHWSNPQNATCVHRRDHCISPCFVPPIILVFLWHQRWFFLPKKEMNKIKNEMKNENTRKMSNARHLFRFTERQMSDLFFLVGKPPSRCFRHDIFFSEPVKWCDVLEFLFRFYSFVTKWFPSFI